MNSPHDFDFLHGEWEVRHRRRIDFLDPDSGWEEFSATSRCWSLFDGAAIGDHSEHGVGGRGGSGLAAAGAVVGIGLLVVVQHRRHWAPWQGARSCTLRASSKSSSVTAPPTLCVFTLRDTVL